MPQPSSLIFMYVAPPLLNSTVTLDAPASKEFSISSFITDAGRSTTSFPDTILAMRTLEKPQAK